MLGPGRPSIWLRDGSRPPLPLATIGLITLNLLIYWYQLSLGDARADGFVDVWGVVPRSVVAYFHGAGAHPGVLVTPLTSMYLHVGALHLATNMLYLWVFGGPVEALLGRRRFLTYYTACGLVAASIQVLAWRESNVPAVGASGAIAGLMAAYLVLRPGATIAAVATSFFFFPAVDVPAVMMLGMWLLSQFVSGLLALSPEPAHSGIAWLAHLGGFLGGLVLVFFFRPRRRRPYHW